MDNKRITVLLVFFSVMFLSLIVYLTTIEIRYKEEYATSNLNRRSIAKEDSIIRGTIYDRNGEKLAYSDGDQRVYPFNNMYAHVIGYSSRTYGKSLVEKSYNSELLGDDSLSTVFNLKSLWSGEEKMGNDVTLTIDHELQKKADALMKSYRGALVAMDPQTGEILAMVSKPDFNPNENSLKTNWSSLVSDDSAPFFSRAAMGLYAPGSTYKMVTSALIFENSMDDAIINDEGSITIDGTTIKNTKSKSYGEIDLADAFRYSSNVFFASVGSSIPYKSHQDIASRFLLNKKIDFDMPYSKSRYRKNSMTELDTAIASIGQGDTLVSPLHLAMITSTIANGGTMMKPHIVSRVTSPLTNIDIKTIKGETLAQPITPSEALEIKDMMLDVVQNGTGSNARISGIEVCGKTGTAENEKTNDDPEKTHALFVAFAPYDDPQIAVAIILEYAGNTGGSIAAPIAREIMKLYLQ